LKKIICSILFTFFLHASYVGNIAEPAILEKGLFSDKDPWIKVQTGYLVDFVNDKKLVSDHNIATVGNENRVNNFEIISNMGKVSISFRERMEIYGMFGQSTTKLNWFASTPENDDGQFLKIESEYNFSWLTGVKIILLQFGKIYFGTDFTYFRIPNIKRSQFFFNAEPIPFATRPQYLTLREWHLAFGLAATFGSFTPYLGGKYLLTKIRFRSDNSFNLKNRLSFGIFLGTTVSMGEKFSLNAEARLHDELAYSVAGSAAF
jgi:hypothetical protein